MNKNDFLKELKFHLSEIDLKEQESIINYYEELISDKMESGLDERSAVNSLGSISDILVKLNITQKQKKIKYDSLLNEPEDVKKENKIKQTFNNTFQTKESRIVILILLIISSPIWGGILIGIIGALFGFACGLFAIFAAICVFPIAGVAACIYSIYMFTVSQDVGFATLGAGLILLSLGLLLIPLVWKATLLIIKGSTNLIKFIGRKIGELK